MKNSYAKSNIPFYYLRSNILLQLHITCKRGNLVTYITFYLKSNNISYK